MDPFVQGAITLGVGVVFLAFLVVFATPVVDRFLDRFERPRSQPPAE